MTRLIAVGFIVIGLVVIAWPDLQQAQHMQKEQDLVEGFQAINDHLKVEAQTTSKPNSQTFQDENVYGLIHIEKLGLTLPLLDDISAQSLDIGAGLIRQGNRFGEPGNIGVAAHRSRTEGRLFSTLDQVERGDDITIETRDKMIEYEVFQTTVVSPEEIDILHNKGDQSIVTLITCTIDGENRLIVQAKNTRL
ncbi:class D sortase [Alkalibacillus almallahensis]|uniref:class D sortase n=1 Tax=Alkalibacillus almallahensis TaxID=1379154 RepID=UPI00141DBB06|nr:class D sortase [Alkalibacillus almallahensis]NIK11912.1 sortase A [Alkalibacillus almallahensis]